VLDEFFAEHCPKHCSYNNPPPSEVIGVAALAPPTSLLKSSRWRRCLTE